VGKREVTGQLTRRGGRQKNDIKSEC